MYNRFTSNVLKNKLSCNIILGFAVSPAVQVKLFQASLAKRDSIILATIAITVENPNND